MLGSREDQEGALLLLQHVLEEAELTILLHFVKVQVDAVDGLGNGTDRHTDGILYLRLDHTGHRSLDSGGEAQRLAHRGDCRGARLEGWQKTLAHHAVAFI